MQRDLDLIRNILLHIENGNTELDPTSAELAKKWNLVSVGVSEKQISEHINHNLDLLQNSGMVIFHDIVIISTGKRTVKEITWTGHDFLDSVRDPEIWNQTKEGAQKVGGFTVDVLIAIAKGLVKKKLKDHTGIDVDF